MEFRTHSEHIGRLTKSNDGGIRVIQSEPLSAPWARSYNVTVDGVSSLELRVASNIYEDDVELELTRGFEDVLEIQWDLLPQELSDWLGTRLDETVASALLSLPAGGYDLVKSPLEPVYMNELILGNWSDEAGPNVGRLCRYWDKSYERPDLPHSYYAFIYGSREDERPALGRPMLGMSFLNFSGRKDSFANGFFPVGKPLEDGVEPPEEHLLILPVTGELVVDFQYDATRDNPEGHGIDWTGVVDNYICDLLLGRDITNQE